MGFFDWLFGSTEQSGPSASINVEEEYADTLNAIECLAKAGAEFGVAELFMYVKCQNDKLVVHLKVDFRDKLQWLNNNRDCLPYSLERAGITESDYEFFIHTLKIRRESGNHDVGEAMFYDDIKNRNHVPALFYALKNRLTAIKGTTCSINESEHSICLHDE